MHGADSTTAISLGSQTSAPSDRNGLEARMHAKMRQRFWP
jgi:hypothetical protein